MDNEDDSDSASEYEPLQISRYTGLQAKGDELGAGSSHSDIPDTSLARKSTEGEAETSGGVGAKPSKGEDMTSKRPEANAEGAGSVPNVSGEAESGKIPNKKGGG